jgi:hypothetical protein
VTYIFIILKIIFIVEYIPGLANDRKLDVGFCILVLCVLNHFLFSEKAEYVRLILYLLCEAQVPVISQGNPG